MQVSPQLLPLPVFKLLNSHQWTFVAKQFRLTERERHVCELLFQCMTRRQIAERLGIKDRTVRGYMEQIHLKLGVQNRVGVVLRIIAARDAMESKEPPKSAPGTTPTAAEKGSKASNKLIRNR